MSIFCRMWKGFPQFRVNRQLPFGQKFPLFDVFIRLKFRRNLQRMENSIQSFAFLSFSSVYLTLKTLYSHSPQWTCYEWKRAKTKHHRNRDSLRWFFNEQCQQPSGDCLHSSDLRCCNRFRHHTPRSILTTSQKEFCKYWKRLHNILINIVYVFVFMSTSRIDEWSRWKQICDSAVEKRKKAWNWFHKRQTNFPFLSRKNHKHMISLFNSRRAAIISLQRWRHSSLLSFSCDFCGKEMKAANGISIDEEIGFLWWNEAMLTLSHQASGLKRWKSGVFHLGRTSSFSWKSFDYWITLKTFR